MAERRMFHASVVESDVFLEMPIGTQALYFHLGMHADDDGFVNSPKQIMRKLGRRPKELQQLIDNGYLLQFDGIIVIRHWRKANYLRSDRMKPLEYAHIAAQLYINHNREYTLEPQGDCLTLLEFRQPVLTTGCPPNIREDKIIEDKITEDNLCQDNVADDNWQDEQPFAESLRLAKYLMEHPLGER